MAAALQAPRISESRLTLKNLNPRRRSATGSLASHDPTTLLSSLTQYGASDGFPYRNASGPQFALQVANTVPAQKRIDAASTAPCPLCGKRLAVNAARNPCRRAYLEVAGAPDPARVSDTQVRILVFRVVPIHLPLFDSFIRPAHAGFVLSVIAASRSRRRNLHSSSYLRVRARITSLLARQRSSRSQLHPPTSPSSVCFVLPCPAPSCVLSTGSTTSSVIFKIVILRTGTQQPTMSATSTRCSGSRCPSRLRSSRISHPHTPWGITRLSATLPLPPPILPRLNLQQTSTTLKPESVPRLEESASGVKSHRCRSRRPHLVRSLSNVHIQVVYILYHVNTCIYASFMRPVVLTLEYQ